MAPKCLLILVCCAIQSTAIAADRVAPSRGHCGVRAAGQALRDTLVPTTIPYAGYRLHLRDIQLLKQRKDQYLLRLTAVNTGARPIGLGPGFPQHILQTDFDEALRQSGLMPLAAPLRAALLESRLTLRVAESAGGLEFWVTTAKSDAPALIARTDEFEPLVSDPGAPAASGRLSPTERREAGADRLYASTEPIPETPSTATPALPPLGIAVAKPAPCVDLAAASMRVTPSQRGSAMLQIEITNLGPGTLTALSLGTGASLTIYLGGSTTITNASQRLARIDLSSRLGPGLSAGLATGQTITLLERIDVSSVTRYTSTIVAQIDPGQVIVECDETNNEASLLLKG